MKKLVPMLVTLLLLFSAIPGSAQVFLAGGLIFDDFWSIEIRGDGVNTTNITEMKIYYRTNAVINCHGGYAGDFEAISWIYSPSQDVWLPSNYDRPAIGVTWRWDGVPVDSSLVFHPVSSQDIMRIYPDSCVVYIDELFSLPFSDPGSGFFGLNLDPGLFPNDLYLTFFSNGIPVNAVVTSSGPGIIHYVSVSNTPLPGTGLLFVGGLLLIAPVRSRKI